MEPGSTGTDVVSGPMHTPFHELTVRPILEEDRESAVQALMVDPLTSAVCAPAEIRLLFDEMVEAQRGYLPGYLI